MPIKADLAHSPIICYVTDRKALDGSQSAADLLEKIGVAAAAGVDWAQIREKDWTARELLAVVVEAVALKTIRVMVNDRLDVALVAGAAGVHLASTSMPVREVVKWCRAGNAPADFLVGVSCHSLEGALNAEQAGASYTYFGPIYETPSKIFFGKPHGTEELAQVANAVSIPVIAIGGVNGTNAGACLRAGATGIASIRMIQEARDSSGLQASIEKVRMARL